MLFSAQDSIDSGTFLSEYWQKKPLLLRAALPDFTDPITPEELAGLACEDDVESRLVFKSAMGWEMKQGPFTERDFTFLNEKDWTLLVQSVDLWVEEVKPLLREAAFIPAWRLDDIMISFAADGGGVGPHFDYYDVFLIQGQGKRLWQIGDFCNSDTSLDTSSGLKILTDFEPIREFELETGDVLYIPAGLSHCGTATEAGLSYSIGFRAPDVAELLSAFSYLAAETLPADLRYRDPASEKEHRPGEIDSNALHQVKALMQHAFNDDSLVLESFGRLMTEPRIPELVEPPEQQMTPVTMAQALQKGFVLKANPVTRFACHHSEDLLTLFVNGECLTLGHPVEKLLALNTELQRAMGTELSLEPFQLHEKCLELLTFLYNRGYLTGAS